jgi:hypothetical protein
MKKSQFLCKQRGATAIILAISAVPILYGVTLAVQTGQNMSVEAGLQDSVDAACLAAASTYKGLINKDPLQAATYIAPAIQAANEAFRVNMGNKAEATNIDITVTLTDEGLFQCVASTTVPQILGKVMGVEKLDLESDACGGLTEQAISTTLARCPATVQEESCVPKVDVTINNNKPAACGQIAMAERTIADITCNSFKVMDFAPLLNNCGGGFSGMGPGTFDCLTISTTRAEGVNGQQIIFNDGAPACVQDIIGENNVHVTEDNRLIASANAVEIMAKLAEAFKVQPGQAFKVDKNCNATVLSENKLQCDAIVVQSFSPISLLISDAVDWKALGTRVSFPLHPEAQAGSTFDWYASAHTPLLVHDPERTGEITRPEQLFGNYAFGKKWANGYEALATLDKNGDGKVSGDELASLGVWFDMNQNGISEAGEVRYFDKLPIDALYYEVTRVSDSQPVYYYAERGFDVKLQDGTIITRPSVDWTSVEYRQPEVARGNTTMPASSNSGSTTSSGSGNSNTSASTPSATAASGQSNSASGNAAQRANTSSQGGASGGSASVQSSGASGASGANGTPTATASSSASNSAQNSGSASNTDAASTNNKADEPLGITGRWVFCLGTGACDLSSPNANATVFLEPSSKYLARGKWLPYVTGMEAPWESLVEDNNIGLHVGVRLLDRQRDGSEHYEMTVISRHVENHVTKSDVQYNPRNETLVVANLDENGNRILEMRAKRIR